MPVERNDDAEREERIQALVERIKAAQTRVEQLLREGRARAEEMAEPSPPVRDRTES